MIVFAIAKDYVWRGCTTRQLKVGGEDMFGLLHRNVKSGTSKLSVLPF